MCISKVVEFDWLRLLLFSLSRPIRNESFPILGRIHKMAVSIKPQPAESNHDVELYKSRIICTICDTHRTLAARHWYRLISEAIIKLHCQLKETFIDCFLKFQDACSDNFFLCLIIHGREILDLQR